ncbi:MAG: anti-sigma factor family protein, partial [Actinomycetota bacterium]
MTTCDDVRVALGALAVGALEPGEERRVREHLEQCPGCAEEMAGLSSTVAALGLVDPAEIESPPEPSPDLLQGLRARVTAARRRRRFAAVASVAASAVIAGVAGFGLGNQGFGQGSGPDSAEPAAAETPVVSVSGSEQGIALQVDAWDKGWGTAVQAEISGVPSGYRCSLVAVGGDGSR